MYAESPPTQSSGFFRISAGIDNVQHVFIYLKRTAPPNNDNAEDNPYLMDTFKLNAADNNTSLSTCKLEYGNGVFYPETEYDAESKIRILNDVASYAMRKTDLNSGSQLNFANYSNPYGLIYFDLTCQNEKITSDPKQLIFRYTLYANAAANFNVHAIVLYEQLVIVNKIGNELVIV